MKGSNIALVLPGMLMEKVGEKELGLGLDRASDYVDLSWTS